MNCTESANHSVIKVEENRRKAKFRNLHNENFEISQVDGCLIKQGIRCDKLVTKVGVASVLVELKGSNVSHACDQLISAVEHSAVKPLLADKVGFLVICSKYPRFDGFVIKAKQWAAKKYKSGFHVIKNEGEFDIERAVAIDGPF